MRGERGKGLTVGGYLELLERGDAGRLGHGLRLGLHADGVAPHHPGAPPAAGGHPRAEGRRRPPRLGGSGGSGGGGGR